MRLRALLVVLLLVGGLFSITACDLARRATAAVPVDAPSFEQQALLTRGERPGAYAIPKLLVTAQGTALVAAQDRAGGDWGKPIDAILIRSLDGGRTWTEPVALAPRKERSDEASRSFFFKPLAMVQDEDSGRVLLFLQRAPLRSPTGESIGEIWFYEHIQETRLLGRTWFVIHSDDEGATWSEPREITQQLIVEPRWQEWSPVHGGIQLQRGPHRGRLVVPVRIYCPEQDPSQHDLKHQTNGVIYSDDGGQTWIPGGRTTAYHGECSVAELSDGAVYLNQRRSRDRGHFRSFSISRDGGSTFAENGSHDDLPDALCHAGLTSIETGETPLLLLSHVPGPKRENLVISASTDDGRTWQKWRTLEPGPAAYSSLDVTPDGTVLCVYETGTDTSRRDIALARFNLPWLLSPQE